MFWSAGATTILAFDRRGASWSVLDGNGKWNGKFGFRRLKPPDCKQGPLAQFGRAPALSELNAMIRERLARGSLWHRRIGRVGGLSGVGSLPCKATHRRGRVQGWLLDAGFPIRTTAFR